MTVVAAQRATLCAADRSNCSRASADIAWREAAWHDPGVRKMVVLVGLVVSLTACGTLGDGARNKRYEVNSPTMEPTITEGSVVTAKVVESGDYQPRTGDIVVFDPPDSHGWNPDGTPRILRVVAVPGDTIACCNAQGRIIRNGTPRTSPTSLNRPSGPQRRSSPPPFPRASFTSSATTERRPTTPRTTAQCRWKT